ncbi:aminotransferase [Elysia marginata]|uniref:Aminotransferase n=1 Tax=Elysia marginata TaxID=1093978 RepID=A0AAV4FRU2_9GAST|nr:aminotransferase [Elysia marginata]
MATKTRELRAEGKSVIGLSLGEPDFTTPDFIKKAAIEAIAQDYNAYSPVDGYVDLKQSIANKFKRDNGLTYKLSQIVVSTGAKQSLANIALAMINEGDEVILPAPYWVSYSEIIKMAGGIPVIVRTSVEQDFKVTPQQLEEAITPKTKMIWYSSPCNPSGSVYSREELEDLARVLKKYINIFVVSDEIYEHINFSDKPHTSMASIEGMYDRTITVNGVSKAYAMTGWRIGFIGASEWIAKATNKVQGQVTSGANTIAQRATIVALETPISAIKFMVDEFHKRRDLVLNHIKNIPRFKTNIPEGAFYVFPDVSSYFGKKLKGKVIKSASDFSLLLLEYAGVATVAGETFGNGDCIRISYAASEEDLDKAFTAIKRIF